MFKQGPTLIILKTNSGDVCGGYTSKSWNLSDNFTEDIDAFVFNLTQRYNCNNYQKAILLRKRGFCFGDNVLAVESHNRLNKVD